MMEDVQEDWRRVEKVWDVETGEGWRRPGKTGESFREACGSWGMTGETGRAQKKPEEAEGGR